MELIRPKTLDEALGMMSAAPMMPLAGGTDVYPAVTNGAKPGKLIDLSRIEDFKRGIRFDGDTWLISPHVTWSDVLAAKLPPQFDGLKSCASEIGGRQIQNRATVIGNICNASPAADGVVAMLTLDARLRLASSRGERLISLDEFIRGNRSTLREPDELLVEIQIRDRRGTIGSAFTKLGARRYLVISIAMVAVVLKLNESRDICEIAISVGACSPKAKRLTGLEASLSGTGIGSDWTQLLADYPYSELAPINDVRASATYRKSAVVQLVQDTLETCRRNLTKDEP